MTEADSARRQFRLGLLLLACATPLAALCTALAAALGAVMLTQARARQRQPAPPRTPSRTSLPRLATPRPAPRADTRRPRRGPRHHGRILH
ncbi:hypothetical protein OHB26_22950 [Nocardia sp. NBC_01503]|uniref:hypothetical protein n=1 Tax=Nocardia sp. NBC_01503 TaxID=2975997 RepID=UPI002E7BFE3A|nr:hypothetical protein [Nocardia sp. NBC_01503]WTL29818.1 hypothetical protein OHB26_22950 [Nocardia sp. NBC_01503]